MNLLQTMLNNTVMIELSGEKKHTGLLIDYGQDIIVIYNGNKFLYLPTLHIQNIRLCDNPEEEIRNPTSMPFENEGSKLSYRKIMQYARGQFVELYVSGRLSLHGYITAIMNNYFVFYSPIYKTVYIPLYHLKWLIPYLLEETPYSMERDRFPVSPSILPLARTFEDQLHKLINEIVVFDLGLNPHKIGLIKKIEGQFIELIDDKNVSVLLNVHHIKTVHSPMQL